MKTRIVFILGILLMTLPRANAQTNANTQTGNMFLGPVVGFGNSWVSYLPVAPTFKPSGYVGISMINLRQNHWGWGGQAIISYEGYAVNYLNSTQTITPIYFRVPLRAYYFFGDRGSAIRPDVYLGPSFALRLSEYNTTTSFYRDNYSVGNSNNFRMADAGIDGGIGLNFRLSRNIWLNMDLGFYEGITDAVKDMDNTYNANRDMDFNIGLVFGVPHTAKLHQRVQ